MSEYTDLLKARKYIAENQKKQASSILWRIYESNDEEIKLNAILSLLVILDSITESEKLFEVIEVGLEIAKRLTKKDVEAYLLCEKCNLLLTKAGFIIYRQKNLKLSANVFKWIDFSTELEKNEFETLSQRLKEIESEVKNLETEILKITSNSSDHYFTGRIFLKLGDLYNSKLINSQLNLLTGGKIKSKIGRILIRRWDLSKWLLYKKDDRKILYYYWSRCVYYFKLGITELEYEKNDNELAHAYYNFAVKHTIIYKYRKAKVLLLQAKEVAEKTDDKELLARIISLYKKSSGKK